MHQIIENILENILKLLDPIHPRILWTRRNKSINDRAETIHRNIDSVQYNCSVQCSIHSLLNDSFILIVDSYLQYSKHTSNQTKHINSKPKVLSTERRQIQKSTM